MGGGGGGMFGGTGRRGKQSSPFGGMDDMGGFFS